MLVGAVTGILSKAFKAQGRQPIERRPININFEDIFPEMDSYQAQRKAYLEKNGLEEPPNVFQRAEARKRAEARAKYEFIA